MLITKEYDEERIINYSDSGFLIQQEDTGILYPEAIDLKAYAHTYIETDIPIYSEEDAQPQNTQELEEIINILFGE